MAFQLYSLEPLSDDPLELPALFLRKWLVEDRVPQRLLCPPIIFCKGILHRGGSQDWLAFGFKIVSRLSQDDLSVKCYTLLYPSSPALSVLLNFLHQDISGVGQPQPQPGGDDPQLHQAGAAQPPLPLAQRGTSQALQQRCQGAAHRGGLPLPVPGGATAGAGPAVDSNQPNLGKTSPGKAHIHAEVQSWGESR